MTCEPPPNRWGVRGRLRTTLGPEYHCQVSPFQHWPRMNSCVRMEQHAVPVMARAATAKESTPCCRSEPPVPPTRKIIATPPLHPGILNAKPVAVMPVEHDPVLPPVLLLLWASLPITKCQKRKCQKQKLNKTSLWKY